MKNLIKSFVSILLLNVAAGNVFAQPNMQQRIEDSVIGWKTVYNFKGKQYKPLSADGQTFSPYQQAIRDSFISWIQQTYKPIGGFGDIYVKDFTSKQNKGPVPQSIGMDALIYGLFKSDRTGKYEMVHNEDHNDVSIYVNRLSGINPVLLFNSPDGYFFTMAKKNYESTFTDDDLINAAKGFGLHDDARFSKYMVYFPSNWVTVVLTPGNKLPIVQLTKGEVLEQCEKGLKRELEEKKNEARHMSSNNPSYYAGVIKDWDEKHYPQAVKNLNLLKAKYQNRLNEPAVLYGWAGPSFADFLNASPGNLPTLFVEDWYQKMDGFPVYRYTKEAIEASKKDKPLWVSITWEAQKPNSRVKPYELHRAMLRYFNYDYVYDYFFNPEKVKGKPYTITNAEEQQARIQSMRKHYIVDEKKQLPAGVFFADDFSGNSEGDRPAGWSDYKGRTPAVIVTLKNKPGKWVQLGHMNTLSPATALKKTLPENFTMEFDVATDEFNVRTGGAVRLSLIAADTKTTIDWEITPGNKDDYNNNNYRGESNSRISSANTGYEGNFYTAIALKEFTNKKTTLHAAVKVNNGQAAFFINGKQVAESKNFKKDYCSDCVCKGIPPNTLFRNITFTNSTQNWSPDGKSNAVNVYISNVKITKE